jgi:hypothetical protein
VKRIDFYYFLSIGLLALVFMGVPTFKHKALRLPLQPVNTMSVEQLSSHSLSLEDKDSGYLGLCSSTAIGKHAVLTAEHCLMNGDVKQVELDMATEDHRILAAASDGRDHVILLLDGTPFKNFVSVVNANSPVNDEVMIYGVGGHAYPPVPKHGHTVTCEDPSDMDSSAGIFCTTIPVIPGDSGSAIYNSMKQVVGVVTYSSTGRPYTNVNFALNFTQGKLDEAQKFSGNIEDLPED